MIQRLGSVQMMSAVAMTPTFSSSRKLCEKKTYKSARRSRLRALKRARHTQHGKDLEEGSLLRTSPTEPNSSVAVEAIMTVYYAAMPAPLAQQQNSSAAVEAIMSLLPSKVSTTVSPFSIHAEDDSDADSTAEIVDDHGKCSGLVECPICGDCFLAEWGNCNKCKLPLHQVPVGYNSSLPGGLMHSGNMVVMSETSVQ